MGRWRRSYSGFLARIDRHAKRAANHVVSSEVVRQRYGMLGAGPFAFAAARVAARHGNNDAVHAEDLSGRIRRPRDAGAWRVRRARRDAAPARRRRAHADSARASASACCTRCTTAGCSRKSTSTATASPATSVPASGTASATPRRDLAGRLPERCAPGLERAAEAAQVELIVVDNRYQPKVALRQRGTSDSREPRSRARVPDRRGDRA